MLTTSSPKFFRRPKPIPPLNVDLNSNNGKEIEWSNTCLTNSLLKAKNKKTVKNKIKIFHQNIQHLASKIEQLHIVLEEINPDIIVLSEHDMKVEAIGRLNLENYIVNSYFSRKLSCKGGIMILGKKEIEWRQVKMPGSMLANTFLEEKQFEYCLCLYKFKNNNYKVVVVGIYRSPSSNTEIFIDRLNILLTFLSKICHRIVVAGDVNINVLVNSREHRLLKNTLKAHNMYYLIDFPTRVTAHSETAIDNFFVKNIDQSSVEVEGLITCLSDHDGQKLEINFNTTPEKQQKPIKQEKRCFSKENILIFSKIVQKENWFEVYHSPPKDKYSHFLSSLQYYFEIAFPKKVISKKKVNKSWVTDKLKDEKQEIVKLHNDVKRSKNKKLSILLKDKKKAFRKNIYKTKKQFFENKISKSDNIQKTVWQIINSEVGSKCKKNLTNFKLKENNCITDNPQYISNLFNNYFTNCIHNLSCKINETSITRGENFNKKPQFNLKSTTLEEVERVIGSLKNKQSCGYDEIPIIVLKECKKILSPILTHLINSSFVTGYFPDELKISKVIPVHKKDSLTEKSNYRPISLLPTISKVYEKIVANQFMEFLNSNNLIDDIQHGFRPERSVTSAAVAFLETIIESVDKGKVTIGVFMDVSKAFDSVNHKVLINKLKTLNVAKHSLEWFASYLENRKQFVEITHLTKLNKVIKVTSEVQKISMGVPQGSILGPLLFMCYLKNMSSALKNVPEKNLCLYADDSNLSLSANKVEDLEILAYFELLNLQGFLKGHNLTLNAKKTKYISFKTMQNKNNYDLSIKVDEQFINKEKKIKFLGLVIDENLNWNEHVNKVLANINSGIYALRKMSSLCNLTTLKSIYFSFIHSHISYGICLYGSTKNENLYSILKCQKKAIRIILNLDRDTSVQEHFKKLKILTVYGQYVFEAIISYKMYHFQSAFTSKFHTYNTRGGPQTTVPQHRLEFFRKKTSYMGAKFFKHLPQILQSDGNPISFKRKLRSFLIDKAIYSLDEYWR